MEDKNIFTIDSYGDECIEKTTISFKWIIERLEENSEDFRLKRKDSKVLKITYEDISKGKGTASNIMKLVVFFDDVNNDPYKVILKVPIFKNSDLLNELGVKDIEKYDDNMVSNTLVRCHSQEHLFYREISNEIKNIKVPKYYGGSDAILSKKSGVIIMDYVNPNKGGIIDLNYPFNIYQAKSVIEEILKLHVFSFTNGKHWRSKLQNKRTIGLTTILQNIVKIHWDVCKEFIPKTILTEIEEDVINMISNFSEISLYNVYHLPESHGVNSVICHGDMWVNNILFHKDSKGRFTNDVMAIVDWQIIYEGSIGADLARNLAINCSSEIRREIEISYLPQYFDRLKEEVLNKNESFNITYETFKRHYDFCFIESIFYLFVTIGYKLSQLDMSKENESIWETRKFLLSSRIYFGIKDAVEKVKILKPEWLIKKD
uniref:CHK domain-containing protein n=1 Tax=Strongyloides venezuelensis TaxID=75913 RepID=A0A0K0FXD0_STRVS